MKYIIFGDESTLPQLITMLKSNVAKAVIAFNRPKAIDACSSYAIQQPKAKTLEYEKFIDTIKKIEPDLILCFSYSMILTDELLRIPRFGAINIHGAILPKYRGANALNWTIINGETETGVTAHFMTNVVDGGSIINQKFTPIFPNDDALSVKKRLDQLGMKLVFDIHKDLSSSFKINSTPQAQITTVPLKRRTPEDGEIKWDRKSDLEIFNLIRALVHPWPGAFFFDELGNKIILNKFITLGEVAMLRKKYGK
jgi:methionyl-tRNA formyltransferase